MIVVWDREIPRSAIISMRSRKLSLNLRYQRTQRMMISRSKWRPLKRSSMLSIRVRFLQRRGEYAPLLPFAPEPLAFTRVAACTLARSPYFVTRYPKASDTSSPPCLLRLLPAGAVAGWDLHPLESAAFSHPTRTFTFL